MKLAKRTLSVLLALLMLVSIIPLSVSAATLKITTQPKTSYTAYNSTAKVTIKATGDGLKYTWYIKNAGASKYTKSSVTGSTYSTKMTNTSKNRMVYCVVKDKKGKTVTSNKVYLRMKATVTTQPKTSYTAYNGTAKATVAAKGDGLKYQWYVKNAGASSFKKSSVTKATYSTKMNDSSKNRQIYCVVTDKYGKTAKSNTVYLRMKASISTQPGSVVVASGEQAAVKVVAKGDGLKYVWYFKNAGASSFKKSSTTTATYSTKMSSTTNGRQVYCVVTDKYGKTVKSKTATLSMKQDFISIQTNPLNRNVVQGGKTTFVVGVTATGNVTYQWEFRKSASGSWANCTLSTAKTNTLSVNANIDRDGYQYRCKITCGSTVVYSNVATLNVTPAVTITTQPKNGSGQAGSGVKFTVEATAGDPSHEITYQWQRRKSSSAAWENVSANTNVCSVLASTDIDGYQYRCAVTANGITVYSKAATIDVWAALVITPDSASGNHVEVQYVAIGEQFTLKAQVSGGAGGYKYKWYVNGEYYTGTSDNGILTYTATFTEEMAKYSGCTIHSISTNYLSAQVEVTDAAGNTVKSADYHVHKYVNIYFNTSYKSCFVNYDNPVTMFYAAVEGGNPNYIEYRWQYSMDGTTWADITAETISSGVTKFAYDPSVNTEALQCRSVNASFLGDNVINNGGIWLRCKATDTLRERTIYSNSFAWVVRPTVSARVSGGRLYVDVSSALGNIESCEWWRHQGQWYINESSTSTSTGFESRWDGYKVTITYDTGVKINVEFDKNGKISKTYFYDAT